jgi:dihydrofolate reductase/thymidylate synthase
MFNIILAVDKNGGIGCNGILPWNIPEELKIFKEKTQNNIIIVGRKTLEKLPKLKDRTIYCLSSKIDIKSNNELIYIFQDIHDCVKQAENLSKLRDKKIFIIGGNQVYNYFFKNYKKDLIVHISMLNKSYTCDTFFNMENLKDFYISKKEVCDSFTHYEMVYQKYGEYQYLNLVKDILENGERRKTRNADTFSDFCKHLKFDLRDGFPLLTTKKMFLKGIIEELLFFIRGDTQSKILEEKGINIWKGNTNREFLDANDFKDRKEGEMGPMYGYQWRHFNSLSSEKEKYDLLNSKSVEFHYKSYNKDNMSYNTGKVESINFDIDQLKFVINEIKTNPTSRRILMTSFNPTQVNEGVLWPCHSITLQFYVQDVFLDMFCYNRSSDIFLGLPFNIASSSLFLMIIAKITNLTPRYFNLSLGDAHIYETHIGSVNEQIKRMPYIFPKIQLPEFNTLEEVEKFTYKDFKLIDYQSYESIKAEMVA